jgi:hypothetical protein
MKERYHEAAHCEVGSVELKTSPGLGLGGKQRGLSMETTSENTEITGYSTSYGG